jgi:hypothetical protein
MISESRNCRVATIDNLVFIIGSGSPEFSIEIDKTKEVLRNFGFEGYFALLSEDEKGLDAFCDKICSKIRSCVFCVVLLNDPIVHECIDKETRHPQSVRAPSANVYYEFGIAVALEKKVIPLIRKDMEPPFDIQHLDVIPYANLEELQEKLRSSVKATLVKGIRPKATVKMPKLGLHLVDKDGKSAETLVVQPIITKIRKSEAQETVVNAMSNVERMAQLISDINNSFGRKTPAKDLVPIGIEIWNEGEIPANNIVVFLGFPDSCELFEEHDVIGGVSLLGLKTEPTFGGLTVDNEKRNATAWLKRLGNDRMKSNFHRIYVRFNTEEEREFQVDASVIQDNYPETHFALKVVVKPIIEEKTE